MPTCSACRKAETPIFSTSAAVGLAALLLSSGFRQALGAADGWRPMRNGEQLKANRTDSLPSASDCDEPLQPRLTDRKRLPAAGCVRRQLRQRVSSRVAERLGANAAMGTH